MPKRSLQANQNPALRILEGIGNEFGGDEPQLDRNSGWDSKLGALHEDGSPRTSARHIGEIDAKLFNVS